VDVENPELHFNISGEFLRQLPLGSRSQWDQLWQLVPGVVTSARSGDGDIEPQIHGASERSNVMKLDGFDIGNAFTNQQWTTQFSTEIIQDVAIKTAGLDASTPLGRGGFLNIVTKSGGNAIHGSGAMSFQPREWNGNNIPGGQSLDQSFYQPRPTAAPTSTRACRGRRPCSSRSSITASTCRSTTRSIATTGSSASSRSGSATDRR
jgi:hypothetical protein